MTKAITSISDLQQDRQNANLGTERGRYMLEQSLRESGAGRSIVVDNQGRVIGGNKVLEIVEELGLPIEVVQSDGHKLIVVQRTDLDLETDPRARRLAYFDNRTAEISLTWNAEQLVADLDAGLDLGDMWQDFELQELLEGTEGWGDEPPADPGPQIDKAAEFQEKWQVKRGDVWQIGKHKLMCGDSTSAEDVARLMGGEKARLCHTDPPYGVDYANVVGGRANQKIGGWRDIENDALDNSELEEFLVKALSLTDAPVLLCWHSWRRVEVFLSAIKRCGWKPNAEIIWVKNALVFGMSDYQWRHETCIYAKRERAGRQENRKETTVWEFNKVVGTMHPTQKPTGLFEKGLQNHTEIGDIVYEPFCGSGSQMVACERLNRQCRAMEIDPPYCAVTLERMADMGLSPVLT